MNRKTPACVLLLVLPLLALASAPVQGAAESDSGEAAALYRRSPREAHHFLKSRYAAGQPVEASVRSIEKECGDFSFSTLRSRAPGVRSGMDLQRRAHRVWEQGDREGALALFSQARLQFPRDAGFSERAFCSYFRAEILSESGRHRESLEEAGRAMEELAERPVPYLAALLQQSRGFSLWYLDRLPESTAAFGSALEIWLQISCSEGILAAWNNLAALYEELGINDRALACYLESLSLLRNGTPSQVRGLLLLNFAGFLHRAGDPGRALRFLQLSRPYRSADPAEFVLTEAEITGNVDSLAGLAEDEPSVFIRRRMVLADWEIRRKQQDKAERLLAEALTAARASGLQLFGRKCTLQMGRLLESQSRWAEAERLYAEGVGEAGMLLNLDITFPFSRACSPLREGWIRTLLRQGRSDEALALIRRFSALQGLKVGRLVETLRGEAGPGRETSVMEVAQQVRRWSDLSLEQPGTAREEPVPVPEGTVLIEYWPDGDRICAWVTRGSVTDRRTAMTPRGVKRLIGDLTRPMEEAGGFLPPPPPADLVLEASSVLIQPIEDLLRGSRLLIVPHGELERVPFEMLHLRNGTPLFREFTVSYLPGVSARFSRRNRIREAPVVIASQRLEGRSGASLEADYFRQLLPPTRFLRRFGEWAPPRRARWVHVAAHLDLDPRLWQLSRVGEAGITDLLHQELRTEVLSLAACEAARSGGVGVPYWMGTAQFLLAAGAQSLVVPRWPLDERSIPIYLEFYRRFEGGGDVAVALAGARNAFVGGVPRDSILRHPFFWAGIIHIGWPEGSSAKTSSRAEPRQALFVAVLLGGSIGLIWRLTRQGWRPTPGSGGGSVGRCRRQRSSGSGRTARG